MNTNELLLSLLRHEIKKCESELTDPQFRVQRTIAQIIQSYLPLSESPCPLQNTISVVNNTQYMYTYMYAFHGQMDSHENKLYIYLNIQSYK